MKIGVISPVAHGTGASCISMLLALRLGYGSADKVCLTHTHPSDSTLRDIGGIAKTVDRTTSTSMLIQTFQYSGAMTEDEYSQYCNAVYKGVDLFTHVSGGEEMTTFEEAKFLSNYAMEKFPHKYLVVDADDHSEGAILDVINRCDVIIFVTKLIVRDIEQLKTRLAKYKKKGVLANKKVMLIFNCYQSEIAQQKDLAKLIGVPPKAVYFMPMSPYIAWATYARAFPKLWNFVTKGDTRVLSVKQELDRIVQGLTVKQKGRPLSKKEIKLFGVKHANIQDADSLEPNPVEVTPAQQKYVEELHKLNYTQFSANCPVPPQKQASELPAGFGGPQQGFGFGKKAEQLAEPVQPQATVQPVNFGQPQAVNFGQSQPVNFGQPQSINQQVQQPQNSNRLWDDDEEEVPVKPTKVVKSVHKPNPAPKTKEITELEQPHNTEAKPVELVSEPSVPIEPRKKPEPKPVIPSLPKSTLKTRPTQGAGVGIKTVTIPTTKVQAPRHQAGGIKPSTIGGDK